MKVMMAKNENIYNVGSLQDLGLPYSLLCIDKRNRQLYVFARIPSLEKDDMRYVVAPVSVQQVEKYMSEELGLTSIFCHTSCYASVKGEEIFFEEGEKFTPNDRMLRMNYFDPELCQDDIWLETFLDRVKNNKPLEIA